MLSINRVQVVAMVLVVLGAITGGTSQLTDLFGAAITKTIVAAASLMTSVLSGWIMILTGQSSIVKNVQSMPGIERIVVNEKANATLATLAVDPANDKIESTPESAETVEKLAKQ